MQMLERYLQAIAFWLPSDRRGDIIAEISEDLTSQIEAQQAALGRTLTETEWEALLKRRGRPVLVANRYRTQQSLIGPTLFPAYLLVLKIVGVCYVLPWMIVSLVVHRAQHSQLNWGTTLAATGTTVWTVAFLAAAMVTLVFSCLQFADTRTHFLENWNPRQLPPVRHPSSIPISTSMTELVANVVFLLMWTTYASPHFLVNGAAFKLSFWTVGVYYYWGWLGLALLNIALAAANLRSRSWDSLRSTGRLLLDLAGGALFCWLLITKTVGTLYIAGLDPARTLAIQGAIHLWMGRCFPIALIVSMIVVAIDLMRIVRIMSKQRYLLVAGVTVLFVSAAGFCEWGTSNIPY